MFLDALSLAAAAPGIDYQLNAFILAQADHQPVKTVILLLFCVNNIAIIIWIAYCGHLGIIAFVQTRQTQWRPQQEVI
jgi:hypothetical protein